MSEFDWKGWASSAARLHAESLNPPEGVSPQERKRQFSQQAELLADALDILCERSPLLTRKPAQDWHAFLEKPMAILGKAEEAADSLAAWKVMAGALLSRIHLHQGKDDPEKPDPVQWLIRNWMPLGMAGMIVGVGGAGKSRLALQLAYATANSHAQWLDAADGNSAVMERLETPEGGAKVVMATWEETWKTIERRRYSMIHYSGLDFMRRGASKVHVLGMKKHGPLWGPSAGKHVQTRGQLTPAGRALEGYLRKERPALVILDPLASAFGGDENVRALVRPFMEWADALADELNCAICLVAHPSKTGLGKSPDQMYSGSSDWHSASRWMWTMYRTETGWYATADGRTVLGKPKGDAQAESLVGIRLHLTKANEARQGSSTWLRPMQAAHAQHPGLAWEQCSAEDASESWT